MSTIHCNDDNDVDDEEQASSSSFPTTTVAALVSEQTPLVTADTIATISEQGNETNGVVAGDHDDDAAMMMMMMMMTTMDLAAAPWPVCTWTQTFTAHVCLLASSAASLCQDACTVPILVLMQPTFLLCFAVVSFVGSEDEPPAAGRFKILPRLCCFSSSLLFVRGWAMIILLRAVPAMDYFYYETTRSVAYLTALAVILIVYLFIGGAVWVQVSLWNHCPRRRGLVTRTAAATTNINASSASSVASAPLLPSRRHGGWKHDLRALVFPILMTALFQILLRFSPIGGAGNPAMGLADGIGGGLGQVAALGGEMSLIFWMTWMASLVAGMLVGQTSRRHGAVWVVVTMAFLVYGGIREDWGRGWYLQDIATWPSTTHQQVSLSPLTVSCLTRPAITDSIDRELLLARTRARLAAGDDLIIWSESAVLEPVTWQELNWTAFATNPGSLVATTFFQNTSSTTTGGSNSKVYNSVALWNAQGLVSIYSKNRPVPVVEANVTGGLIRPTPTKVDFTPLATTAIATNGTTPTRTWLSRQVATAVCFDLDFDYLSRHAHTADLMIGPSWYWASIGNIMWSHNTFQAIENGFHLIKCSERGISGHVDPYGRTMTAIPTLENEVHIMQVPLSKGVKTIYASFGYVFGWISVGLAPVVLIYVGCYSNLQR